MISQTEFVDLENRLRIAIESSNIAEIENVADHLLKVQSKRATGLAKKGLGWASFLKGKIDEAESYFMQAQSIFEAEMDFIEIANVTNNLGSIFFRNDNYKKSLEYYHSALKLHENAGSPPQHIANVFSNITNVFNKIGLSEKGLEYAEKARELYVEIGDSIGEAKASNNAASIYTSLGNYPTALELYTKALSISTILNNVVIMGAAYSGLGSVYASTDNFYEALVHYQKSVELFKEIGNNSSIARAYTNIGSIHSAVGHHEHALQYFQEAKVVHEENGSSSGVAFALLGIAGALHKLDRVSEALASYLQALEMFYILNETQYCIAARNGVVKMLILMEKLSEAAAYLQINQSEPNSEKPSQIETLINAAQLAIAEKKYSDAQVHLQSALNLATTIGQRSALLRVHELLRTVAYHNRNLEKYVEHNTRIAELTVDIHGQDTARKIAVLEKQTELQNQQKLFDKYQTLLYGTLPKSVAERLLRGEAVKGDAHENCAIVFLDIVNFTNISSELAPNRVVELLECLFDICDEICTRNGLTKIKTIGDSYMAVANIPEEQSDFALRAAKVCCEILAETSQHHQLSEYQIRFGVHCGPVIAGVLGKERLQYDVWGDTVNVASRMESTGMAGKIHITEAFKSALEESHESLQLFSINSRGEINVKGKGLMSTFWLEQK